MWWRVTLLGFLALAGCAREHAPPAPRPHHAERWGGTRVLIAGGDDKGRGDGPVIVYLHGYASVAEHQLPLADPSLFPRGTRFVFPEGPLALRADDGPRRAWWMLDHGLRLRLRREPYGIRELAGDRPPGMARARAMVLRVLDRIQARLGAPPERTVIAGFSQGAMLACDVVLRSERPIAGVGSLSGSLVSAQEWVPRMHARRGLRAFVSHGRDDVMLPFALSERLAAHLTENGLSVRWYPHAGGHEMRGSVVRAFARFVEDTTQLDQPYRYGS